MTDDWKPTTWFTTLSSTDKRTLVHLRVSQSAAFGFSPYVIAGVTYKWSARSISGVANGVAKDLDEAVERARAAGQLLLDQEKR